jgi:DNA invertase Pin-like site-specific DNA recombinase
MALGPRRLRDIAKPVEMFQVLAVGLDSEFPPLTTLDPTPGNLRPQATSFIGREKELAEVEEALSAHRLVTLTGVGGVGKTRLATEVAARLADEFADGVWFFELAAVADPTSVPDAVAAVLGITQQPGKSVSEQRPGLAALLDYAREGDAIVVVGIDRLGRNAAEVMTTIRELGERGIVLRSLREGIDTSNATGRMIAGVLASLAELELGLGRERRAAAREARRARGQHIGRPKVLDKSKVGLAQRMHGSGESASTIASMLGVSRATVYRVLAEQTDKN